MPPGRCRGERNLSRHRRELARAVAVHKWSGIVRFYDSLQKGRVDPASLLADRPAATGEPIRTLETAALNIPPLELPKLELELKPIDPDSNR